MDGGMVKAAAMAGYGVAATVVSNSRFAAQKLIGGTSTVIQAAQTYQYTSQAARDTGSTPGEARAAGAKEAVKTLMTGPEPGGPRSGGDHIYSDSQRGQQYADVRAGATANTVSAPSSRSGAGPAANSDTSRENGTSAGSKTAGAQEPANSNSSDSWGAFASDRKETGGKNA
jgi:hypothetical protein